MKSKDVLIGALSTLAVTVLGGVAVYYFTKEPEYRSRELLTYSVRTSGDFSGEKERVAFTSVVIANHGGKAANNVTANISFAIPAIKDLSTETVAGITERKNVSRTQAILAYPKLLPGESVTVDLLLSAPARPVVVVRSDDSFAVAEAFVGSEKRDKLSDINKTSSRVVPISLFFFVISSAIFLRRAKKLGLGDGMLSDRNNAAFLLLHSGLSGEAEEILNASVRSGRYDSYTLSNLAVSKALNGEEAKSAALMKAATFRKAEGHTAAVLLFNEALLAFMAGKRPEAMSALRKAMELSPKQIKMYCERSVHFDRYRSDPDFIALMGRAA